MSTAPKVEDFLHLSDRIARRAAWAPHDIPDLQQEGLLALHRALQKEPHPNDPQAFAFSVMSGAMSAAKKGKGRRAMHPKETFPILDDYLTSGEEAIDVLYLDEYFAFVEQSCGKESRTIAENLVAPSAEVGEHVLEEVAEKEERMAEDPSLKLRGTVKLRLSHRQLQEALGLPSSRWYELLGKIREVTRRFLRDNSPGVLPPED